MVKAFRHMLVLLVVLVAGSALRDAADVHEAGAVRGTSRSSLQRVHAAALRPARGVPSAPRDGGGPGMRLLGVAILHAQQPPPQQQDEFVPIDELPPQDQLPAAPLLVAAYSFVVLALFAYVLSVARRVGTVQRELERFGSELKRSGRA